MSVRQQKKSEILKLVDGGRPVLAPIRQDVKPLWIDVGDAAPEFKGWCFSVRPAMAIQRLTKVIVPLAEMQALGEEKVGADLEASEDDTPEEKEEKLKKSRSLDTIASFLTRMSDTVDSLSTGLATILVEWNFVNEDTGEALPAPAHNPEVISTLETKLVTAIASLVVAYLSGTPPNASKPTSKTSETPE